MVRFIYPGGYRSRIPGLSWLGLYIQEETGVGYLVIMVRFVYPGGYRSRIPGLSWLGLYIQEDKGVGYLVYYG